MDAEFESVRRSAAEEHAAIGNLISTELDAVRRASSDEHAALRGDVAEIRDDIRAMRSDLADLRERTARLEVHVGVPAENR